MTNHHLGRFIWRELVTKDVTIHAPVRTADGSSADRTLVVTMQRAILQGEPAAEGKWIITGVRDATTSPGVKLLVDSGISNTGMSRANTPARTKGRA